MNPLEEFEAQKKEIDESKLRLKNKYEELIRQREEEINTMKEYEDLYFKTKDQNRKLVEDIHAKKIELEMIQNNDIQQDKEII